jgi:Mg2+ and Co2+ transporter CorA
VTYPCLDLFLVDPPPFPIAQDVLNFERITASMQNLRFKTRLRVQCPGSCGIDLPQLLRRKVYSLRQTLHSVFRHTWQIKIMFDDESVGDMAIKSGELLHLISASLHRTNFVTIDREIKAISFQELRNPDMRTNTKLLTLREVLSELATGTAETSKYAPSQVHTFYGSIYDRELHVLDELDFHSPIARLAILSQQADELQRFLMDSFQLLMSSISVKETQNAADQAKMSMEQAVRTAKLTQLAFVYIPLTFVTGVFGMNVRELSDPVPALWVCAVTLVVIAAATAAIFGSYKYKPVNLLSDLLKQRKTKTRGLRWTAVTSEGTGAMVTDEEKGPTRSGLAPGC